MLPPKTKPQKSSIPKEAQKQAALSRPAVKTVPDNRLPSKASPPMQKAAPPGQIEKGPQRPPAKERPGAEFPLDENPPAEETRRKPTAADMLFNTDVIKGEARSYVDSHLSKSEGRSKAGSHDGTDISFDADDMKYNNYLQRLRDQIESVWTYPQQAGRSGAYGDLYIKFTINKDGTLAGVGVSRTSGHRLLDDAAVDALRRAFPFYRLPDEWGLDTFTITGHFIYTLNVSEPRGRHR
jgi:protein TonB